MHEILPEFPFQHAVSLKPLLDYWENVLAPSDEHWAAQLAAIRPELENNPELREPLVDWSRPTPCGEVLRKLMNAVFPPAFWEYEAVGALEPLSLRPFFVSPEFERLMLDERGSFRGKIQLLGESFDRAKIARAYLLILHRLYGMPCGTDYPLTRVVPDPETGLDRYFRIETRFKFMEVKALGELPRLSPQDLERIAGNVTQPEHFREILPPELFAFYGFSVVRAVDVTESEVLSLLGRDLVDRDSVFSHMGFMRLQQRLRALFRVPELVASLAAIQGDQVLMLNKGCATKECCIFSESTHLPMREFEGSSFHRAVELDRAFRVPDILAYEPRTPADEDIYHHGIRSVIIAPLKFRDQLIGIFKIGAPTPGAFGHSAETLVNQIAPLFSMALKRSLDELDHRVGDVVKKKCTAVHASVEWRFKKAALAHLERHGHDSEAELEPIIFPDVYPLYGATDIRGSSDARIRAIQADLMEHLGLAAEIAQRAGTMQPLGILQELEHRLQGYREQTNLGLSSGDDFGVIRFLRQELEPIFPLLSEFGPAVGQAVDAYRAAVDPGLGTVYRCRKAFEESVSLFNERVSAYLDREEAAAQAIFPHYFDKHQTDGVDYIAYMGRSMLEEGEFNDLYVRNLRLWQIVVACGIAWHTEQLKPLMAVPLEATHLILVTHTPLSIRFRFEEKRFEVDGAYNIGHAIIRSRIDKATVKGARERLTQPGRIAIVYSRADEAQEMTRYLTFLQAQGLLLDDLESLDLDELPGVKGLKALRVGIDLESAALAERAQRFGLVVSPTRDHGHEHPVAAHG
ncbi:MAG: GAF domain-containing protein [Thermodesulfobacteriota bacterium]